MRAIISAKHLILPVALTASMLFSPPLQAVPRRHSIQCSPSYDSSPSIVEIVTPDRTAYRQCRAAFFDTNFSAWFTFDCLIPIQQSEPGVFAPAMIPGIGQRMAWVIEVYGAPKVNPPGDFPQIPVPAASAPHPAAAMIIVRLPAKATLSVNGKPVAAPSGETRIAVRNLDPKNIYEYRLQASVHRDNRTVLEERTISFQAGTRTVVDFGAANKPASLANSR